MTNTFSDSSSNNPKTQAAATPAMSRMATIATAQMILLFGRVGAPAGFTISLFSSSLELSTVLSSFEMSCGVHSKVSITLQNPEEAASNFALPLSD
jgi:hypothetical protein